MSARLPGWFYSAPLAAHLRSGDMLSFIARICNIHERARGLVSNLNRQQRDTDAVVLLSLLL